MLARDTQIEKINRNQQLTWICFLKNRDDGLIEIILFIRRVINTFVQFLCFGGFSLNNFSLQSMARKSN